VGVHLVGVQARACGCGGDGVFVNDTFDGVARQSASGAGGEQRLVALAGAFGEPDADDCLGWGGEWNGTMFAACETTDVRSGADADVTAVEAGEFGHAKPGLNREEE
jgi:hypothetical protein